MVGNFDEITFRFDARGRNQEPRQPARPFLLKKNAKSKIGDLRNTAPAPKIHNIVSTTDKIIFGKSPLILTAVCLTIKLSALPAGVKNNNGEDFCISNLAFGKVLRDAPACVRAVCHKTISDSTNLPLEKFNYL